MSLLGLFGIETGRALEGEEGSTKVFLTPTLIEFDMK
jgi:hypothetical protein